MGERKPSYKSLQQREAEYAEARKRILGAERAAAAAAGGEGGYSEGENGDILVENGDDIVSPKLATRCVRM